MRNILFVVLLGLLATNSQANSLTSLGLGNLESSSSAVEYTLEDVKKIFTSNTPACFKDGSKLLGVNAAYSNKYKTRKACTKKNGKRLGVKVITTNNLTKKAYNALVASGAIKL